MTEAPEQISISEWVKRGGMLVRRELLPFSDPEYPYNYIKREYGVDPERYGIFRYGDTGIDCNLENMSLNEVLPILGFHAEESAIPYKKKILDEEGELVGNFTVGETWAWLKEKNFIK